MTIGELAAKAGVNIQTIRYYERKRMLRPPPRTPSGYRTYSERDVESVLFIRRCQTVGFSLKEIQKLAELHVWERPPEATRGIQQIARERLRLVEEQIESLQSMRVQLLGLVAESNGEPAPVCPFKKP